MKHDEKEYGFYSLASEFLEAAKILNKHIATNIKVDSASIYLICHAAELFLKAYLLKQLGKQRFLEKKYGHNINKLIGDASDIGLSIDLSSLLSVASIYQKKQLEYRPNAELVLANIDDLMTQLKALSYVVFDLNAYIGN